MKQINGSIIAPDSPPNSSEGVFDLNEIFQAQTSSEWPTSSIPVKYLVIAGGGAGGYSFPGIGAGGGGAGGYRSNVPGESSGGGASAESFFAALLNKKYVLKVGDGGGFNQFTVSSISGPGFPSYFGPIQSIGGGGGGQVNSPAPSLSGSGGSGGGARRGVGTGGLGTPGQGYNGGVTLATPAGAGGGGAGGLGGDTPGGIGGAGGIGVQGNIDGTPTYRGGGGGGMRGVPFAGGAAGLGGGGEGVRTPTELYNAVANTGGGGGGGSGLGGSGIVILRYPNTATISNPDGGLTYTTASLGSDTVATFTSGVGYVKWS